MSLYRNSLGALGSSPSLGALAARRGGLSLPTIAAQLFASYDWGGENLPDVGAATGNWVDTIGGVPAVATGTALVGTLNGQKAALTAGAQYFRTAAFAAALTQPTAIVSVAQRTGAPLPAAGYYHHDGIVLIGRNAIFHSVSASLGRLELFAGTTLPSLPPFISAALIAVTALYNGASSSLVVNGIQRGSGNAGTQTLTGITIGASWNNTSPFVGPIARVTIFAARPAVGDAAAQLADLNARATAFAAACQTKYSIS